MSRQLHIGDQSAYSQFAPDSELPLANRIITRIPCSTFRTQGSYNVAGQADASGDFETPMSFQFSMNNGLMFLRSCILRLPIAAKFYNAVGELQKDENEISQIGLRNRPAKCFTKIDTIVNGFTSNHLPEQTEYINEYTFTDDDFENNLPNEGDCVPISRPFQTTRGCGLRSANGGDSKAERYNADVQSNPNFVERCKRFRKDYDRKTGTFDGTVDIPLECGMFRPYSSKKAVRTKFVPYIGTANVQYQWKNYRASDSYARSGYQARALLGDGQTNVAKYLFEKCGACAEAAAYGLTNQRTYTINPYRVLVAEATGNVCLIVPHTGNSPLHNPVNNVPQRVGPMHHHAVRDSFLPGTSIKFDAADVFSKVGLTTEYWSQRFVVATVQDATGRVAGAWDQTCIRGAQGVNNQAGGGAAGAAREMDFGYAGLSVYNNPYDWGQDGYPTRYAGAWADIHALWGANNSQFLAQNANATGAIANRALVLLPSSVVHFGLQEINANTAAAAGNAFTDMQPRVFCIYERYTALHNDRARAGTIRKLHVANDAAALHMQALIANGLQEQGARGAANNYWLANFGANFTNYYAGIAANPGIERYGGWFRVCSNRTQLAVAAPGANNVPGADRRDLSNVLFYDKTIPGYADDIDRNNYPFTAFPNQYHGVSCSRDHISKIDMFWRSQPEIVCEWAVLQRTEPVYRLFYPQYQYFLGTGTDGDSFQFQLPSNGATVTQRITGTKLNEVPNQIILYAQIHENDRFGLEWLDLKPLITSVKLSINERPDLSSDVPLYLGYRWFVENTGSTMTRSEWEASNFWVISPQQLGITPQTFTESMRRVSTLDIEVQIKQSRPQRKLEENIDKGTYPFTQNGAAGVANMERYIRPTYQFKAVFYYSNHALLVNAKREMMLIKNTITAPGPSGLVKEDRFLPRSSGLSAM